MQPRCLRTIGVCLGVAAGAALGSARAGIIDIQMTAGASVQSSLHLPDGVWNRGDDWDWGIAPDAPADEMHPSRALLWMNEVWVAGNTIDFETDVLADADPDIRIVKTVNNDTTFAWTDYHIDLVPQVGGPIIVNPLSVSSNRFSNIMVMNHPNGSASIWFLTDPGRGDTPVLIGQQATLTFEFNIPPGPTNYKMIQTPTPEPASLALLGLGALAFWRRR